MSQDDIYLYGISCSECGCTMEPVFFTEDEYKTSNGSLYKTGRKRLAVDYLICPCCLTKECVDDSFDGPWY